LDLIARREAACRMPSPLGQMHPQSQQDFLPS